MPIDFLMLRYAEHCCQYQIMPIAVLITNWNFQSQTQYDRMVDDRQARFGF